MPEVAFFFWLIKIMCTTVGETAADYLFVGGILALVTYLSITKRDQTPAGSRLALDEA